MFNLVTYFERIVIYDRYGKYLKLTAQENKNTHHHGNMRCDQDYVNNAYINKDSDDNNIL